MAKFTLEDITKLVNEELEKYSKKQALISEKAKLESELKTLSEVVAGKEMQSDKDYHQGQKEPEFEMKGSHILEDTIEEGVEMMVQFDGNDVTLAGTKVGEMKGDEFFPVGDEDTVKVFSSPNVKAVIEKRFIGGEESSFGRENVAEMEHDFNDATMEGNQFTGDEIIPDMADDAFVEEPRMANETEDSRMKRFDTDFEGLGDGPEFDAEEYKDPIPDMADPISVPETGVSDEESVKAELPTWMMGENEMEEEVDLDAQIKEDLEEMMEPEMAEEISETISEMDGEKDDNEINPADYSGLGEGEVNEEVNENEEEGEFEETFYESVIDKRRKSIMSESMLKRMKVLSGQSKRWDRE